MRKVLILSLVCLIVFLDVATASKIVFFISGGAKSHKMVHYPLAAELIKHGHDVTMLSIFKPHEKIAGLKEHHLVDTEKEFVRTLPILFDDNGPNCTREMIYYMAYNGPEICYHYLRSPPIKNILEKGETFDLAIINGLFNDCALPLAKKVAKSMIYVTPGELSPAIAWNLNIPTPSYAPSIYLTSNTIKMNIIDRISNAAANLAWILFREFYTFPQTDKVVREVIPEAMSVKEAERYIELVLVNRHHVIDYNMPSLPFVHEIGGITVRPAKALPKELDQFVSGSGPAGFILVSFGSVVQDEKMPEHAKKAFIEMFSRIPQRVVWKFTLKVDNLPPNVMRMDWLPQNDLLGHPKCAAFFTHGGHFGLMETVYHGVPIIGLPVFADQPANLLRAQDKEFGIKLDWDDVTADKLVDAMNTVVNNTRYKQSIKQHQTLFKDELNTARQRAVYWIERVLRHPGKLLLRAEGADRINFLEYFLLDAIALLAVVSYLTIRFLKYLCCSKKSKKHQEKRKTKRN